MNRESSTSGQTAAEQAAAKKKHHAGKTLLVALVWIAVIALVIFLTLFFASKIGQFDSIPDLITYIRAQI